MIEAASGDPLPAGARAAVLGALAGVVRDERVAIPLAIESGSRAWGFPSPDSDFDCRFVYVRRRDDYVSLFPPRDVIELPLIGDLDVNGWDLAKALRLILKGNAVAIEWLNSPVSYRMDEAFRAALLRFAATHARRDSIRAHYLHLGLDQRRVHLGEELVSLKKLFYVLRPAASLRWMRLHEGSKLPPMHFPTLMAEGEWPAALESATRDLLARKAVTREMGRGPAPAILLDFIADEFDRAAGTIPPRASTVPEDARRAGDALLRELIGRYGEA